MKKGKSCRVMCRYKSLLVKKAGNAKIEARPGGEERQQNKFIIRC